MTRSLDLFAAAAAPAAAAIVPHHHLNPTYPRSPALPYCAPPPPAAAAPPPAPPYPPQQPPPAPCALQAAPPPPPPMHVRSFTHPHPAAHAHPHPFSHAPAVAYAAHAHAHHHNHNHNHPFHHHVPPHHQQHHHRPMVPAADIEPHYRLAQHQVHAAVAPQPQPQQHPAVHYQPMSQNQTNNNHTKPNNAAPRPNAAHPGGAQGAGALANNYNVPSSPDPLFVCNLTRDTFVRACSVYLDDMATRQHLYVHVPARGEPAGVFFSVTAPHIATTVYVRRLVTYAQCSPAAFVVMLVLLDRVAAQNPALRVTPRSLHRLLTTALTLACKLMDDRCFPNAHYARVGGVPSTHEMNRLELAFLFAANFKLHVTTDDFAAKMKDLEKVLIPKSPRSIFDLSPTPTDASLHTPAVHKAQAVQQAQQQQQQGSSNNNSNNNNNNNNNNNYAVNDPYTTPAPVSRQQQQVSTDQHQQQQPAAQHRQAHHDKPNAFSNHNNATQQQQQQPSNMDLSSKPPTPTHDVKHHHLRQHDLQPHFHHQPSNSVLPRKDITTSSSGADANRAAAAGEDTYASDGSMLLSEMKLGRRLSQLYNNPPPGHAQLYPNSQHHNHNAKASANSNSTSNFNSVSCPAAAALQKRLDSHILSYSHSHSHSHPQQQQQRSVMQPISKGLPTSNDNNNNNSNHQKQLHHQQHQHQHQPSPSHHLPSLHALRAAKGFSSVSSLSSGSGSIANGSSSSPSASSLVGAAGPLPIAKNVKGFGAVLHRSIHHTHSHAHVNINASNVHHTHSLSNLNLNNDKGDGLSAPFLVSDHGLLPPPPPPPPPTTAGSGDASTNSVASSHAHTAVHAPISKGGFSRSLATSSSALGIVPLKAHPVSSYGQATSAAGKAGAETGIGMGIGMGIGILSQGQSHNWGRVSNSNSVLHDHYQQQQQQQHAVYDDDVNNRQHKSSSGLNIANLNLKKSIAGHEHAVRRHQQQQQRQQEAMDNNMSNFHNSYDNNNNNVGNRRFDQQPQQHHHQVHYQNQRFRQQ